MSTMVTELVVPLAYGTLYERGSKLRAASVCDTLRERREVRATPTKCETINPTLGEVIYLFNLQSP
ncbi:hypothetical protein [Nostoc sp.]|uniref:hypothetical protein n=1 Tax=Nostoc sp. TaxID=1180 RepID=UPI002FF81289